MYGGMYILTCPCFASFSQKEFLKQSTPRQKKNCLQNFDLSEHRQILSDLAIHIYHRFIALMEKALTPTIGIYFLEFGILQKKKKPHHYHFWEQTSNIHLHVPSAWHVGARESTGDFQHEANGLQEAFQQHL